MTLTQISARIRKDGISAEVRGSGRAEFVFAKSAHGAVELSEKGDGIFWLEYWEPGDEAPTKDKDIPDADLAIRDTELWLAGER